MTATPSTVARGRRGRRAVVVAAAVGLALTGCSSSEPEPKETPRGALEVFFEQMWGDYDEDKANADMMRIEELKAECMSDLGFEYVPVDWSAGSTSIDVGGEDDIPWGTLEFAEEYGYGVTINPWEGDEGGDPMPEPIEDFEDPNMAIVEAMSEAEQAAYWEALYGKQDEQPMPVEGDEDEWVPPSWEDMGCSGWADHEVYGDGVYGPSDDDPFMELQEEMNRMWESMMTDERILEAEAGWASCMADAGYPGYAKVGDAEQEFYTRSDEIRTEVYEGLAPDAGEDEWMAAEEEIQRRFAALSGEEIELAVADYTCRDDAGYTQAQTDVNVEYQQRFYDEHKTELEQWAESQTAVG